MHTHTHITSLQTHTHTHSRTAHAETTFASKNRAEVTKTLQYVRRKIKNETAEQRKEGLSNLIEVAEAAGGLAATYFSFSVLCYFTKRALLSL